MQRPTPPGRLRFRSFERGRLVYGSQCHAGGGDAPRTSLSGQPGRPADCRHRHRRGTARVAAQGTDGVGRAGGTGHRRTGPRRAGRSARQRQRPILRLGHRRCRPGGAGRRLARRGVGPEWRHLRSLARGERRRGSGRQVAQRRPRSAGAGLVCVCHRLPDGPRHGLVRSAPQPARRTRLGRDASRPGPALRPSAC